MGHFGREAGAALTFLILYVAIYMWMTWAYLTKRIKWRSRYSLLFFHVTIRVASQACGVAFGVLGFANTNVFLAYLILGAEGYFTLVLCAFRFLISWHQHNLPSHESWLEPHEPNQTSADRLKRVIALIILGPFAVILYWKHPMVIMHTLLILANMAIIIGGSYLAGADLSDPLSHSFQQRVNVAKITRTAGQSVFLACNFLLLFTILATIRGQKKAGKRKIHPTLILLFIAWFPLIIRGIFGILQAAVWSLSYYNPDNYDADGFTPRFVAIEYVLGVVTEWLACLLLNLTYFTSLNDPSKGEITSEEQKIQKS
ncbi:hypothetical protein CPB84DRAFT_1746138 [Gymnopilus junonius]|uniref:Uncharacterized protein n=1 Tax=Gymnopilus junonius TaxID=109634 RepID=A0A9P5NR01_GYMJU|nr:hypothetical protein CPB84DRAFT_1746138 [Gymnopilus junonius]